MGCAFVIGNGESRRGFKLGKLRGNGFIIGCNALYRDFSPDLLVSVDSKMIKEVKEANYAGEYCSDNPYKWASGPTAVKIACERGYSPIYMLGFDFYGHGEFSTNGQHPMLNNFYKDTKNYRKSNDHETGWRGWIDTFKQIFASYPETKFIHVGGLEKHPPKWPKDVPRYIDYLRFEAILAGKIKVIS